MPDLDASLRELREDLRSTIAKPGLDKVADRARQRTVRRRMQIGAIVAVVLVSVAVPLLRSLPDPTPPATPPPARTQSVPYELAFADRTNAYALGRDCGAPTDPCTFRLLASDDGGRSWARRTVPAGEYADGALGVLGPDVLRLYTRRTDDSMKIWASRDGGRTWHDYDTTPRFAGPSPIPPGAMLEQACLQGSAAGCVRGVVTVNPDGTLSPAPTQPPLTDQWPGTYPTASGVHWVIGRDESGHWAVATTGDGTKWWTAPLDVPGQPERPDAWSVVEGGGSMYLTVVGTTAGGTNNLLVVYRSTDRGHTWQQTYHATDGRQLSMYGGPVATSDGRLLVNALPDGTLESRDGTTFTRAAHQLPASPKWTPAGYVLQVRPTAYQVSWNGLDWRQFEVPAR